MSQITMYGAAWCSDCRRSKKVLDASGFEYVYIDVSADPHAEKFVREVNGGKQSIPVIVLPDGTHLTEPSDLVLGNKLTSLLSE